MDNKELIEYYETKMNNDIDWQNTNSEDLLNFRKESNEEDSKGKNLNEEDSNEEDSKGKDSNEEDSNEEKVTLKNLENLHHSKILQFLRHISPKLIKDKIDCVLQDDGFHVVYQIGHSCERYVKLSQQAILGAVRKVGERNNLKSKEYNDLICKQLGLKPNSIDKQIIYRAYRKVFGLTIKERLNIVGKVAEFHQYN